MFRSRPITRALPVYLRTPAPSLEFTGGEVATMHAVNSSFAGCRCIAQYTFLDCEGKESSERIEIYRLLPSIREVSVGAWYPDGVRMVWPISWLSYGKALGKVSSPPHHARNEGLPIVRLSRVGKRKVIVMKRRVTRKRKASVYS